MANIVTSLADNVTITAASLNLQQGVQKDLLVCPEIDNGSGTVFNSIKIVISYSNLLPAGVLGSFFIGAQLEAQDQNLNWVTTPLTQFSALRLSDQPLSRVLVMQPNIDTFNLGVDDSLFPLDREICRVSRVQGTLPDSKIRLRFSIVDGDPAGPAGFDEITISAEAERYSV